MVHMMKFLHIISLVFITFHFPLFSEEVAVAFEASSKSFSLSVTREEAKVIDEIITTLGKNSVIALGFKQGHLRALGKKLNGVSSLQFLGYIFSHKELKEYMLDIRKSALKWNGFIDGMKPGLTKEAESKQLFQELSGFAKFLQVNYTSLETYAKENDWEKFVQMLLPSSSSS